MSLNDPVRNRPGFLAHAVHVGLWFAWFAISGAFLCAQDRSVGHSIVATDRGVAASSHFSASQAGNQILAEGGSAMDAAIAANGGRGETEPMMKGIGGDVFHLYWDAKTGKLYGLTASRFNGLAQ